MSELFVDSLSHYKEKFETEIEKIIGTLGPQTDLRDACEYALKSGGKRFRPIITLLIGDALGKGHNVMPVALAVEFFHTASLIADDLPSMDNEDRRRDIPTLHKAFSESVALLASYTLISLGYEMVGKNAKLLKNGNDLCVMALDFISKISGIMGATNGQFLDLAPPDCSLETIYTIIYQKTVTLFEISFILGWLFGGGNTKSLELVKECAYHFGMAFQIADDLVDRKQDAANEYKTNIADFLGAAETLKRFNNEITLFKKKARELGFYNESFESLVLYLSNLASNKSL